MSVPKSLDQFLDEMANAEHLEDRQKTLTEIRDRFQISRCPSTGQVPIIWDKADLDDLDFEDANGNPLLPDGETAQFALTLIARILADQSISAGWNIIESAIEDHREDILEYRDGRSS